MEEGKTEGEAHAKRLDLITQEKGDVWDSNKGIPLPGALGFVGVELGPNGEIPEGFRKDEEGNVIVSFQTNQFTLERKNGEMNTIPRLSFVIKLIMCCFEDA